MDKLILGIESSCDETAAAVVKNGREILSNVINTQIDLHKKYGGVVPEIASRKHIQNIDAVVEEALKSANVTIDDDDAFKSGNEIAKKEGILVGISSGACVKAAEILATRPENKGKIIVALLPDTGERYLSTTIFE